MEKIGTSLADLANWAAAQPAVLDPAALIAHAGLREPLLAFHQDPPRCEEERK